MAIHDLALTDEADETAFEQLMIRTVFASAAETPGSVNRRGQSAIASQHLLKDHADSRRYLWVVKDSGALVEFSRIAQEMFDDAEETLKAFDLPAGRQRGQSLRDQLFVALPEGFPVQSG